MMTLFRAITPAMIILLTLAFSGATVYVDSADARSKFGGKSFRSAPKKAPTSTAPAATSQKKSSSFAKGLAGGLLGGAIGSMLFGSMFGGEGMGLLPLLLLAGGAYFLYRKMSAGARAPGHHGPGAFPGQTGTPPSMNTNVMRDVPPPPPGSAMGLEAGLAEIRSTDPGFDPAYFKEVASDVFFQVQAGWMRRDLDSYRHLLGDTLAAEYEDHFAKMREQGVINKLESIAIRGVEVCEAGSTGSEDFVTVLFTANLLDYTVDEASGDVVEGSMTTPVKFAEEWTWARPIKTDKWRLEGIKVVNG